MNLFIIRHAIAEERTDDGDDTQRALTKEGREKFKEAVAGLKALGYRFDRLYHSPWRRAVETAEEAAKLVDGELTALDALAGPPRDALLSELRGVDVAVVGHEPWLGELIAWLVTGELGLGAHFVMKKGGVAWLEGTAQPGKMTLRALLPPKVLRAASRSSR
ncbi:MAG: histidine phosphatase family protein [Myxococcaceae bacterium]|nr:histidine phosphatase family protein [Myxococcaceae bacterium]